MATTVNNTTTPSSLLLSEPLDKLPVHLNTILIQIGKLFKHQAIPEQRVLGLQKKQAHDVISKTTRKYHDALDEIEIEILNARAVLERDLNAIKARQAEREHAQLAAARTMQPEGLVPVEGTPMSNTNDNTTIKSQSPGADAPLDVLDDDLLAKSAAVAGEAQTAEGSNQPAMDLKDIDLRDDLFGDAIAGDFGPVDENANFDLFNSTTGGDFDMDFSVEPSMATNTTSQVTSAPNDTAGTANVDISVDNDLLMQSFADVNATENAGTNDFADLDFDTINQTQDDVNISENPFGDHSNTEFDDFFNS